MPVEIARLGSGQKFPSLRLKKIALAILPLVDQADAELSVVLIGDAEMRKLNARYRGKDYPTDVLSFPLDSSGPVPRLLGDVIISVETARRQARQQGRALEQELTTLLIHGIVHLLGYDHERSPRDARLMKRLEDKIFRQLCEQRLLKV